MLRLHRQKSGALTSGGARLSAANDHKRGWFRRRLRRKRGCRGIRRFTRR